ncbi:ABC transporter ATP-binding protein [Nocardioides sp. Kera G14]|uniref:ABC transporter ATP-binding protein n=1 Tax=Nocardioides sp. Kera G14 TaxID=2884264 RepID=UPI001D12D3EA|nr:ABC transporter ATP-binding protein [Nocardioides sp. Kera G14]UDY23923.1 ABC transporter ATP-binding protein [Nocardioides sp. Kera G14]
MKATTPSPSGSVLIEGLRKSYDRAVKKGSAYAIDGVSFEIPQGSLVTLLGPSGCGKTTTLRCVAGLEQATEGRITMGGKVVFDSAGGRIVRTEDRPIAMVPQSYGIWPHMTVLDNAAFPLRHGRHRMPRRDARTRTLEVLEQVGLAGMADRWATQLSGGQQQRLALARALLGDPEVLLLDEPLSNLDAKLRVRLRHELREFQQRFGITALFVTHDQTEALTMSDTVVVMNSGVVEQIGTPEEVYDFPRTAFVADFIGSANLVPVELASQDTAGDVLASTAVGTLHCGRRTAGSTGTQGEGGFVFVRPENVEVRRLEATDDPGDCDFTAVVESAEFLGDRLEVVVGAAEVRITAFARSGSGVRPGDRVGVRLDPASTSYLAS